MTHSLKFQPSALSNGHAPLALRNPEENPKLAPMSIGLAAAILVPTLVVGPWLVSKGKPEWSYDTRVGASAAGLFVALAAAATLSPPKARE